VLTLETKINESPPQTSLDSLLAIKIRSLAGGRGGLHVGLIGDPDAYIATTAYVELDYDGLDDDAN